MLDEAQENKVKCLHKKLYRSFKTLQECIPVMQTCINKEESLLKELCMLCEQYRECQVANVQRLQLPAQVADVKSKILHMIVERINDQLKEIRVVMSEYQKLFDRIHESKMRTFKDLPQISYLIRPNWIYPTFAVMLEWVDDSEKEVYAQLCLKYEFLDTLNYKDEELWQKCTKTWIEADTKILEKFGERLAHLQDFLVDT